MWGSYLRNDIRTDMKTMAQNLAHEDCKLHRTQLLVGVLLYVDVDVLK